MDLSLIKEEYKNPPVPAGFKHVGGEWNTGFIIRQKLDAFFESPSEFVWVPTCLLPADGTQDAIHYDKQFGARPSLKYSGEPSAHVGAELAEQIKAVEQYGGFYMSRYLASMDDDAVPCSVEKRLPHVGVCRVTAAKTAHYYDGGPEVSAHMPYAAEMDSLLAWLLQDGKITQREIRKAAAYRDSKYQYRHAIYYCGIQDDEKNGFFDVLSNSDEWTQESYDEAYNAGCGLGCSYPSTARCYNRPYACYKFSGYRLALTLKK